MILMLIISCFASPYEIAFPKDKSGNEYSTRWVFDKIFDFLFFMDVVVSFFCVVVTDQYTIIDDRK